MGEMPGSLGFEAARDARLATQIRVPPQATQPTPASIVDAQVSGESWTQVRVSFAGSLVEVTHLRPGQGFSVGENPDADLVCAIPGLHRLVMATATGAVIEHPGSGELESVALGESARLELGDLSIEIGCEAPFVPVLDRRPVDRAWWLSLVGSALALVPLLALALIAAQTQLPPLETEPALGMAYTVRTEAKVDEPERDYRRPPPPEQFEDESPSPRKPSVWTPPRNLPKTETETEAGPEVEAGDWPGPVGILQGARARGTSGPRPVAAMLQRDSSPVEAARRSGVLGAMPSEEELEDFVAVSAGAFGRDVDDRALWAAMTDGPIDTTIGGLELTGSGRSGGSASGVIRSGAPERPPASESPLRPSLAGAATLRARVVSTHVEGGLEREQAQRFVRSLADEWIDCVESSEVPVEFEIRYSVRRNGKVSGVEIPRNQLPAAARRCVIAAVEASDGLGTKGQAAKIEQRVTIRRGHGSSR